MRTTHTLRRFSAQGFYFGNWCRNTILADSKDQAAEKRCGLQFPFSILEESPMHVIADMEPNRARFTCDGKTLHLEWRDIPEFYCQIRATLPCGNVFLFRNTEEFKDTYLKPRLGCREQDLFLCAIATVALQTL